VVTDIRRATRRHFSAEDEIRIVLDGLRGQDTVAELCRKEGIAQSLFYTWAKAFMGAGKRRLAGDTARAATPAKCWTCAARPGSTCSLPRIGVSLATAESLSPSTTVETPSGRQVSPSYSTAVVRITVLAITIHSHEKGFTRQFRPFLVCLRLGTCTA
jgi:transposase-like protein